MDAQLVRAARLGEQPHPCACLVMTQDLPFRHRRAARLVADLLQGAVWPIHNQGQINHALFAVNLAPDQGEVGFLHHPLFELQPQMALRGGGAREDNHA